MDRLKGFHFKKKWGQHFIFDKAFLNRLVDHVFVEPGEGVLEIGAGAGTLTRVLAERGARVLAVEIDPELTPVLRAGLGDYNQVRIVCGDVMTMDLDRLAQDEGWRIPYKIAANLPYAISTPLLTRLMARTFHWQTAVLMVQKEVAEKLTARPGDAAYGILSLAGRVFGSAEIILKAPAHVFTPMPAVESALVRLIRRPVALEADTELLRSVIQRAFGQRRKTLLNALKGLPGQDWASALELAGIDPRRRGETLSLEEYLALVEAASR